MYDRDTTFRTSVALARKPNYGFEKRQKELDRQKKKDAKLQARQQRTTEPTTPTEQPPQPERDKDQTR
jgi:hypothetical protein